MIPRRIWINLAAFGALFAVLCFWAATNVVSFDFIDRPYRIVASFESSPGLRPNIGVAYHGVQVGKVDAVELGSGQVDVTLAIDRGVQLPRGLTAAVRRKSAVGEPYVALEPPECYAGGGPFIEPGDDYAIGVESTDVPISYAELFTAIEQFVDAVPEDDAVVVLDELAAALGGRGPELRTIIESTADLTGTLADESATLDALASDLTSLTHAIAERRDAIGTSFDNVAALTETLAGASGDIDALLAQAPAFGDQVATLFDETVDDLGCLFADIGSLFRAIGTEERVLNLVELLRLSPFARDALDNSFVEAGDQGADGPYLGGSFVPDVGLSPAPPIYETRPTLPEGPALESCAARIATEQGGGGEAGVAGPGEGGTVTEPSDRSTSPAPGDAAETFPASSDRESGSQKFPLLAVALAFGLALLAVAIGALRPWRLLPFIRRGGDQT